MNSQLNFPAMPEDIPVKPCAKHSANPKAPHLQSILSSMPVGVYACDAEGRITFYNKRAVQLWGREPELNDPHEKFCACYKAFLLDGTYLPPNQTPMAVALREGTSFSDLEATIQRPDGTKFTASVNIEVIRDDNGTIIGAVNAFQDVTKLRRMVEFALRSSEEQLATELRCTSLLYDVGNLCAYAGENLEESLSRILDVAISIMGAQKGTLQLMDANSEKLHIKAHHGFKEPFLNFFNIVDHQLAAACGAAMKGGKRIIVEDITKSEIFAGTHSLEVLLAAGVRAVQSTLLVGSTGNLMGVMSTHFREPHRPREREIRMIDLHARQAADYIERRKAEESIRQSELRLRTMAEALPNLVWTDLPNGQCDWLSSQWGKYTGIPEKDLLGLNWLDRVVHPDDRERTLQCWQAACADLGVYDVEYRIRRHDGQYRWFKSRGVPMRDEQGRIIYWFGTCTDIEDMKRAEADLKIAREEAENASRAKDHFLRALSHELRTPLNPVLLLAGDAASNKELPPAIRADFDMIRRNVELETGLIDDLLDLTRISSGKLKIQKCEVEVQKLLEIAISMIQNDSEKKRISIKREFHSSESVISADAVRVQQIFWNILKNAVKFTPHGGVVTIETRVDNEYHFVTVSDTGIGMTQEELKHVFEAFKPGLHSEEARQFGGLGLGLAITKNLVELHSGLIEASSQGRNRGARFTVKLPLSQRKSRINLIHSDAAGWRCDGSRVLLVEDDESTRVVLTGVLERRNYKVTAAASAGDAITFASQQHFDLIISDIGLPDRDGYDLFEDLRRQIPEIKGIALTGYGAHEDRVRSRKSGFAFHLTKPINVEKLDAVLNQIS